MALSKEPIQPPAAVAPRLQWASVRKAVPADAGSIATVYDEVYRGTYSYEEFADPAYLSKDISNRWHGWYVIAGYQLGDPGYEDKDTYDIILMYRISHRHDVKSHFAPPCDIAFRTTITMAAGTSTMSR